MEEANEVVASINSTRYNLVHEVSELLFHLMILLTVKGLSIKDIATELRKRQS